jgi:hypothetical protein
VTVICVRDGIIAADSQYTIQTNEGGSRKFRTKKLFPGKTKDGTDFIIGTAGGGSTSLTFARWYGSGKKPPKIFAEEGQNDFTCLVLQADGLWEYDAYCIGEKIEEPFHAIGCGAKAALGAMHMGATAEQAVEIACRIDPYCCPPILTMSLPQKE